MDKIIDEYEDGLFSFDEAKRQLYNLMIDGEIFPWDYDWAISLIKKGSRYEQEMEEAEKTD